MNLFGFRCQVSGVPTCIEIYPIGSQFDRKKMEPAEILIGMWERLPAAIFQVVLKFIIMAKSHSHPIKINYFTIN